MNQLGDRTVVTHVSEFAINDNKISTTNFFSSFHCADKIDCWIFHQNHSLIKGLQFRYSQLHFFFLAVITVDSPWKRVGRKAKAQVKIQIL